MVYSKSEDLNRWLKGRTWSCLTEEGSWTPPSYASRSMTEAEIKYAQIEKECLGLTYGFDIFHCYVYGLPTDHRPLESIIQKI